LGLPPELPVKIEDPLLERFILIDPQLTGLQNDIEGLLSRIRTMRDAPRREELDRIQSALRDLIEPIAAQMQSAGDEMSRLDDILPVRREQLLRVREKIEALDADVDPRVYDVDAVAERIAMLQQRVPENADKLRDLFQTIRLPLEQRVEAIQRRRDEEGLDRLDDVQANWQSSLDLATELSDALLELSLVQAEIRLQGITLEPTKIDPPTALEYARNNRLDWMNARANLVDVWRKIEFTANTLRSDFDIVVDGSLATRPDNVLEFDGDESRLRFGARFDTPTARLAERNAYRTALIEYQRARRDYMLFSDRISQSLRNTLRTITLSEINLEVRRVAVQVAIAQVDIARLKLNPPLRPNQPSRTSPTAARDLVSALTDLLDAQNDFLNVWVANQVLRVLLDFEMGTMELDPSGVWVDSGIAGAADSVATDPRGEERSFSEMLRDLEQQFDVLSVQPVELLPPPRPEDTAR